MRKGFSLVEMLAVILVLTIVSAALAGLFTAVVTDIPRSHRVIQTNTTLLNMLEQMHKDIDTARGLPVSFGEYTANNEILLIELEDGMISYQIKDDKVIRRNLMAAEDNKGGDTRVWLVPHAKLEWQVWRENGDGYAVQVKTHIEHKVRGHLERKMANSHLYFVGAFKDTMR